LPPLGRPPYIGGDLSRKRSRSRSALTRGRTGSFSLVSSGLGVHGLAQTASPRPYDQVQLLLSAPCGRRHASRSSNRRGGFTMGFSRLDLRVPSSSMTPWLLSSFLLFSSSFLLLGTGGGGRARFGLFSRASTRASRCGFPSWSLALVGSGAFGSIGNAIRAPTRINHYHPHILRNRAPVDSGSDLQWQYSKSAYIWRNEPVAGLQPA